MPEDQKDDAENGHERRSPGDRRRPRSSFVERIGKAKDRRSGKDRRDGGGEPPKP